MIARAISAGVLGVLALLAAAIAAAGTVVRLSAPVYPIKAPSLLSTLATNLGFVGSSSSGARVDEPDRSQNAGLSARLSCGIVLAVLQQFGSLSFVRTGDDFTGVNLGHRLDPPPRVPGEAGPAAPPAPIWC